MPSSTAVRVAFHDAAIHECARVALVAVADDIANVGFHRLAGLPFLAGRKSAAAATTQIGFVDFGNHLIRRHGSQNFGETLVAADRDYSLIE